MSIFESKGLPDKPIGLSAAESRLWDAFMRDLPARLLKHRGASMLHLLCTIVDARERAFQIMSEDRHNDSAFELHSSLFDCQMELSKVFGLSPLDRQNIELPDDDDDDEFEQWMRGD